MLLPRPEHLANSEELQDCLHIVHYYLAEFENYGLNNGSKLNLTKTLGLKDLMDLARSLVPVTVPRATTATMSKI